tara:strand:+ start:22427 stop:24433 length:2007 start_codon:yes stop_codon:yes gene_type:complete
VFRLAGILIVVLTLVISPVRSYGQACVLDSSEHADLLTSIKKLKEKLSLVPEECKTEGTRQAFQSVDGLKDSSGKLHEFVTNQAMAMDATQFGTAAQTAIDSVNSITKSLKSAGSCLKSKDKKDTLVSILSSVSDVTMNLAPVLMAATIFMPMIGQMGLVGKIATGAISKLPIGKSLTLALLVGVSAKVIEGVSDLANDKDNPLDMKNPEHRNLVAKSICDYQRINKQIRELSKFNNGRIDYSKKYQDTLKSIADLEVFYRKKDPKVADLIVKYHGLKSKIKDDFEKILIARKKLADFDQIYIKSDDPSYRCSVANNFVSMNGVFKDLQMPKEDHTVALLKVIEENKTEMAEALAAAKAKGPGTPGYDHRTFQYGLCVKAIDKWKANVAIILGELGSEIQGRSEKVYDGLLADRVFNEWRKNAAQLEADSVLYEKIDAYISKSGDVSQLIPQAELIIEFRDLDRQLFGANGFFSKSLAGKWLEHRLEEYDDIVDSFNDKFSSLNVSSNTAYIKQIIDAFNSDPKNRNNQFAYMELQNKVQVSRRQYNLENLTPALFIKGASKRDATNTCSQLQDLVIESNSANKVYNSAGLFCYYLRSSGLIKSNMDKYVISNCVGHVGLEDDDSKSGLKSKEAEKTRRYGLTTRTAIVHSKSVQLGCYPTSAEKKLN